MGLSYVLAAMALLTIPTRKLARGGAAAVVR